MKTDEERLKNIAESFGFLECDKAVEKMKRAFPGGNVIHLYFPHTYNNFVVSDRYKDAISRNGNHYGYEYRGKVHCNVYPEGMELNAWIHSFHAASDEVIVKRNGIEVFPDAAGIYH